MDDPVYEAFLETVTEDAAAVNAASDIVAVVAQPTGGSLANTYDGVLREVEHLEGAAAGTAAVSVAVVRFSVHFPADYCRSSDPNLQFRVARVHGALLHPNCRGGILCLGPHFRPGTRLRPLVEQIYGIVAGRVFATDHAFDAEACRYYLHHLDQVRALRARPLWRRRVAAAIHVEPAGSAGDAPRGAQS